MRGRHTQDYQNETDPVKQNMRLKEKVGGLELTVRSQMDDLNRSECGRHRPASPSVFTRLRPAQRLFER